MKIIIIFFFTEKMKFKTNYCCKKHLIINSLKPIQWLDKILVMIVAWIKSFLQDFFNKVIKNTHFNTRCHFFNLLKLQNPHSFMEISFIFLILYTQI
jgi:hypothetical protein